MVESVAERTGYPPDMLDLDAHMEADLGIDSIKRVEIIASARTRLIPSLEAPPEWFMDEMAAAQSMRAIGQGLERLMRESGDGVVAQAPLETAAESPAETADLAQLLLEAVSERTGYPAEMLDVDADMEADLGIDSIKRVEITTAVRKRLLPDLEVAPEWFMDEMAAARSMRAIAKSLEQLVGGAGVSPAASPSPGGNGREPLERPLR